MSRARARSWKFESEVSRRSASRSVSSRLTRASPSQTSPYSTRNRGSAMTAARKLRSHARLLPMSPESFRPST